MYCNKTTAINKVEDRTWFYVYKWAFFAMPIFFPLSALPIGETIRFLKDAVQIVISLRIVKE